jgi:hypothetical protein
MLRKPTEFYASLPPKCCDHCGDAMEEMADCYSNTCTKCKGTTFYPLSPIHSSPTVTPVTKPY